MDSKTVETVAKDATNKFGAYCNSQTWCTSVDHDCVKCREDFESGYKAAQAAIATLTPQWSDTVPDEDGFWWADFGDCMECLEVRMLSNMRVVMWRGTSYCLDTFKNMVYQWAKATPPGDEK